jgi:hypothetical protein
MTYEFPPPEMKEGCEAFIMDWEDKDVENKVCLEITKACKGVNLKDVPRMDDHILVDG